MEFIEHFHCPFVKKNGTTYATDGFEAVAPITAKVDDNWGVKDHFVLLFENLIRATGMRLVPEMEKNQPNIIRRCNIPVF